jgi:lipopolysaccharide transport system ATP-binding protein
MSSSTTPEKHAIRLREVSKSYRLFGSQRHQLLEVLGLGRFLPRGPEAYREFTALSGVNLDVPRGGRVGIVGRNGAGKTTLLKLICGNFAPSSGKIEVNGTVQALMSTGLGFHPEYTGRENVLASLQYNGLGKTEYQQALDEILDFCELGEFIDQPFKTYSLGMQARLMFAASTAVRPDILIVDEVLGAGDAYFVAKSRQRMERLVTGGCTMLLVSHSTQQVLEMCERAIWLDKGKVRMEGDAFEVVKSYEEFVHGSMTVSGIGVGHQAPVRVRDPDAEKKRKLESTDAFLQEPKFVPHEHEVQFPPPQLVGFEHVARGGISRWEAERGVKVTALEIGRLEGVTNKLVSMEPARIAFALRAEMDGHFNCRYGFAVHDHLGRCITRIFGPRDEFELREGDTRTVEMILNPLQIGPGDYTLGLSVLDYGPLETINTARRFDLLGRSFEFKVEIPESIAATECLVYHTAEWRFH